jgi:hypothetical protein
MYLDNICFYMLFWFLLIANVVMLYYLIKTLFYIRKDVKQFDAFIVHETKLNNNLKKYKS